MSIHGLESATAHGRVQAPARLALCLLGMALLSLPGAASGADPSATGGGEIRFDLGFVALDYQFSLNAVTLGTGDVSGHFNVKLNAPLDFFPYGRWTFKARVSCLEIEGGDVATLSGLSVGGWNAATGTPVPAGLCWLVRVVDGGQGLDAEPDLGSLIGILPCGDLDPDEICRDVPPLAPPGLLPFGVVRKGNVQIEP